MSEIYLNAHTHPPMRPCVRHWVHPTILVGGNLNDDADYADLSGRLGIRSVINLDARSEAGLSIPALCEVPVDDNGQPFPTGAVRHAVSFAKLRVGIGAIYVHCHIGVSRSPAFAYGILRWVYEMSRAEAVACLNSSGGEYGSDYLSVPKHGVYLDAVDAVLSV
jgi:hypothetical protein